MAKPDARGPSPLGTVALTIGLLASGFRRPPYAQARASSQQAPPSAERLNAMAEGDRGRHASTPAEIPLRGWNDILLRVYENIGRDRVIAIAAGVTFYGLLAIFPAIAAFVALYGLFADPATIATHLDSVSGLLPGGALDVIRDQLESLTAQRNDTLGLTFISGLAIALWSANAGVKSLFDALNLVYNEREKRSFIALNAQSLLFTLSGIVFLLVALGAMVVLPVALDYLGLAGSTKTLVTVLRWPALFVVVSLILALLYRYGPSREKPRWRWVTWGSVVAALAWLAVSVLFSWYAENFGSYNKTYGSLGAVVGFMVWMWLSTIVILLGAEIDAEMEHQTARDTTTGRPRPLGARGATMADTVGAAKGH